MYIDINCIWLLINKHTYIHTYIYSNENDYVLYKNRCPCQLVADLETGE